MSMKQNVQRCVLHGLGSGIIFSVSVVVLFLFRGPDAFEREQVGLGPIVAFYLGGGAVGGLIVGLLWPLLKWRVGAHVTSVFVALLVSIAGCVLMWGDPTVWDPRLWFVPPTAALLFGLKFGNSLWRAASGR